ncbi:MAG: surface lipoprotein assembly modifier [Pseudomonadota bacterium]
MSWNVAAADMPKRHRVPLRGFLMACFLITTSGSAWSEDPRIAMQAAWQAQDYEAAIAASQAVLAQNPDEYLAHALQARVARIQGNRALAEQAARRAWDAADNASQRHEAARTVALTLFEQEEYTTAQLWLRRAIQNAPTPEIRAATIRDFRQVRRVNPWQIQLTFSVNQSDNVNAGSSEDTWQAYFFGSEDTGGIPFELPILGQQQALSGTEYIYGGTITRSLTQIGPWRTEISAGYLAKDIVLSDEAREQAPTARSSDYDLRQLTLGTTTARTSGRRQHTFDGELSYVGFGGEHLSTGLRLGYTQTQAINQGLAWKSGGAVSRALREDRHISSSWRKELSTGPIKQIGNSIWLGEALIFDVTSDSNNVARDGWSLQTRWVQTEPATLGARLSAGLEYGVTTFDSGFFGAAEARRDEKMRANVAAVFSDFDLYGFSPSLEISHTRTNSNVTLYTYDDTSVVLGIKSAF